MTYDYELTCVKCFERATFVLDGNSYCAGDALDYVADTKRFPDPEVYHPGMVDGLTQMLSENEEAAPTTEAAPPDN